MDLKIKIKTNTTKPSKTSMRFIDKVILFIVIWAVLKDADMKSLAEFLRYLLLN